MIVQPRSMEGQPSPSPQLGKYQLVATLGQGGMGTVYLALASGFGQFRKLLVVKELRQDLTRQKGFVSMFMDEAKLAARLAHPNVVQTFEASEVGDRYFIAMEYLDGQSLSALLDRLAQIPNPKFSLWMHLQILCDALSGLHYAHELLDYDESYLQVVHRDVSPQNVFVTYHGQVKVVDFGVAKVANATVKTASGVFVGKFSYAAPEQVMGATVDARTDVFAAGVMLWQAIARMPFSDRAPTPAACRARCDGLEPRISEVVPNVDPMLAEICDRALAIDPDERFASAKEFRAELLDYMQQAGVRIEASEIGQLMHEVFDTERRSMHVRVEQAMRRTGDSDSGVDELVFDRSDKDPTAVADLSSLVEVSLERDDQKIQQGYAHSKITLVRHPSDQEAANRMSTPVRAPRKRLFVFAAGLAVLSALIVIVARRSASSVEAETHVAAATLAPTVVASVPPSPSVVPPAAPAPAPVPDAKPLELQPENIFMPEPTVADSALSLAARKATTAPSRSSTSASSSRQRSRATTPVRSPHPESDPPEPVVMNVAVPEPTAPRRPDEGTDLSLGRRSGGVRIDSENPYR